MQGDQHIAKQLDCTTSIASSLNNEIHGVHFAQHMTFNRPNHVSSIQICGWINIWVVDWTSFIWNDFNQHMLYKCSSLDSILGSPMFVGSMIICTSSEHYTCWMPLDEYCSFVHISHFRRTSILNQCALQTLTVVEYMARWTWMIAGWLCKVSALPERQLCHLVVHLTKTTWLMFQATSMPGCCNSQLPIFEKISIVQLNCVPGIMFGRSPVPHKVPTMLTKHNIPQFEQCRPYSEILPKLALSWNGIMLMDFRDNVTHFLMPRLWIIKNKSWLLNSHMACMQCVKFLMVCWLGIQHCKHLITQEISIFSWSCWTKLILMFCILLVFIQSATSSGNTLSAISFNFGSLINSISSFWV